MNAQEDSADLIEILSTKEVLERLKIGRSKLFELKKSGKLRPGLHYFQNGRVLRFIWTLDLLQAIHDEPLAQYDKFTQESEGADTIKSSTPRKSPIDFEYH